MTESVEGTRGLESGTHTGAESVVGIRGLESDMHTLTELSVKSESDELLRGISYTTVMLLLYENGSDYIYIIYRVSQN